jgi:Tfp pilus assembly protein PilN
LKGYASLNATQWQKSRKRSNNMVLSQEQIQNINLLSNSNLDFVTRTPEFFKDILDTIASKDTQIQQLQEKLEKCKTALYRIDGFVDCDIEELKVKEIFYGYKGVHIIVFETLQAIE